MTNKNHPIPAFVRIQADCAAALEEVRGKVLNDATMRLAQYLVDCVFRARQKQRKFVVLDDSGIQLTAVKLKFNVDMETPVSAVTNSKGVAVPGVRKGGIGVDYWCTAFYPNDPNRISTRFRNSVALGTVNGIQVFINNNELCAERERGRGLERYSLDNPVPPDSTSILFPAYLRARSLGHIK